MRAENLEALTPCAEQFNLGFLVMLGKINLCCYFACEMLSAPNESRFHCTERHKLFTIVMEMGMIYI
jgi:hypothetical protein